MPTYTFRGDTPKSLAHTTPPFEVINPGDVIEVAEDLLLPEFEPVKGKSTPVSSDAEPTKEA